MSARRSREDWEKLFDVFEKSGQSAKEFCRSRRIRPDTFKWWRWRLARPADAAMSAIELVPVDVKAPAHALVQGPALVVTVAGVALAIPVGADIEYVTTLVARLRDVC